MFRVSRALRLCLCNSLAQIGGRITLVRDAFIAESVHATPFDARPGADSCRI